MDVDALIIKRINFLYKIYFNVHVTDQIKIKIHVFMLQSITINNLLFKSFFNNGCKEDPQKALLKAASIRAASYGIHV